MSESKSYAKLLVNGDQILPSLLADIRAATKAIHISMFLWFDDPIGQEIAAAVLERAQNGATVRVLFNVEKTGMGDPFSTGEREMMKQDPNVTNDPLDVKPLCEKLRAGGVEVADTDIDYDYVSQHWSPRLRSVAAQINDAIDVDELHIDHRKLVTIDQKIAYCGGANIGAQYMFHAPFDPDKDAKTEAEERLAAGAGEPWWKWHDSLTRFEGPIVRALDHHFHDRFVLDGGNEYEHADEAALGKASTNAGFELANAECVANEPNDVPNPVRELYVRLIEGATRSIFIENPYLYHPKIVEALCAAKTARPELDVVLVLPSPTLNDNDFSADAQQYEYARYLECGIAVYEYQNHFNHLKMAVFDERHSIHGSTNGNCRSLEDDKDFELVVHVDDEALAKDVLARVRDVDVKHAKRITKEMLEDGLDGFRMRHRDPRTLLLLSRCEL